MGIGRFQNGQRVVDNWEWCAYYANMYKHISVGVVLEVREDFYGRFTYRIRWTHGPKCGKITYMKHLLSYDEVIEKRRETLSAWNQAFDNFYTTSSKEPR